MQVYFHVRGNAQRFIVTQTTDGKKRIPIGFTGCPKGHTIQAQIENDDTCYTYITTVVDGTIQDGEWQNKPVKVEVERSKTLVRRGRRYEVNDMPRWFSVVNIHIAPESPEGRTYDYIVEVLFPKEHDIRTFTVLYGGGDFGEVEIVHVIP